MVKSNQVVKVFNIKTLKDLPDVGYEKAMCRLCAEFYLKVQRVKILEDRIEEIKSVLREYNVVFNEDQRTKEHQKVFENKHGYFIDLDKERKKISHDKLEEFFKKNGYDLDDVLSLTIDDKKVKKFFEDKGLDLKQVQDITDVKGAVKPV